MHWACSWLNNMQNATCSFPLPQNLPSGYMSYFRTEWGYSLVMCKWVSSVCKSGEVCNSLRTVYCWQCLSHNSVLWTWSMTLCSYTSLTLFPSQTNVSPQTQGPQNCSTLCSLSDHNPATTVSPSAMLEESHREALCSEREEWFKRQSCSPQWHVGQSYYVCAVCRCTSSILPSFSLLCAPPIPCLFLLPPTLLTSFFSSPSLPLLLSGSDEQ